MTQDLNHARRAAGLLIAAAALPFTAAFAQETQPPAEPPPAATTAPPPAAQTAPVDLPATPAPTLTQAPPPTVTVQPPSATATTAAPRPAAPTRTVVRVPTRTPVSVTTASRTVRAAPIAAATAPAAAAVTTAPAAVPVATTTATTTTTAPAIAPAPEPAPVPVAPATEPTDTRGSAASVLPWVLAGLVGLGIIAFALSRRRRRANVYEEDVVEAPVEPVAAAAPVAAVAADDWGRPWIDLKLEPVRAGVEGEEARVEFALKVDNHGVAPARDVRVSAFMLQAGASEAEQSLIAPKEMPPVTVAAGETKQVETAVALPTDKVRGDAVLPVVVADARYTLPDGSEGRTSASFAVGVPDGEELAHFSVDNPSGLHDDVVARPLGEMEKA